MQETWLRLSGGDPGGTDDLRGWLTVVVGRICLDMLAGAQGSPRGIRRDLAARADPGRRRARPRATRPDALGRTDDPEAQAVMADSVGLALLVVLDTLSPPERLAFVLHDVFARLVRGDRPDRGTHTRRDAPTRQPRPSARAGRATAGSRPGGPAACRGRVPGRRTRRGLRGADRAACTDVVFRSDGGGSGPLARPPLEGAAAVARYITTAGRGFAAWPTRPSSTAPRRVVVARAGQGPYVIGLTVAHGRIAAIDINGDPAKLAGLHLEGDA